MAKTLLCSLPLGFIATIVSDAISSGSISQLIDGGQVAKQSIGLSSSVVLGPFGEERDIVLEFEQNAFSLTISPYPVAKLFSAHSALFNSLFIVSDGVPVDYTDGTPPATGEGVILPGGLCFDTTNGDVYRNSGTQAEPVWTQLADAA